MVAVGARKRAIEALEHFADVVAKEQEASTEEEDDSGTENSGSESSD